MSAYWTKDEEAEPYNEWVNGLLENAPENFDDDVAAEEIVTRYVRWLETQRAGIPTQAEVLAWVAERWPEHLAPVWRAMKSGEEAGEILGAVIKEELGLKPPGTIAMESAQAVLCIMSLAESVGFDLWAAVAAEWTTLQTRKWSPS